MLDGVFEEIGARQINPRQNLAVVDHSNQFPGFQFPEGQHTMLLWILVSEALFLAVSENR